MTANQINYWNLKETNRHNVVTEAETGRHNLATEFETNRHNVRTEDETERHNRVTEQVDLSKLDETRRHNLATESQTSSVNAETARHNYAQEQEAYRHNKVQEGLGATDLNIQADKLSEDIRHNVTNERLGRYEQQLNELKTTAEANYKDALTTWQQLQNSQHANITDMNLRKVQQEIDKLRSDIARATQQNDVDVWRSVNDSVNAFAKIVDAFIPG